REARTREPALSRRVLPCLRRRRPRAVPASEAEADHEEIIHPAEIDLRIRDAVGEALIGRQITLGRLIPNLAAAADCDERERHAAEDDGPGAGSICDKRIAEDAVVARVDEIAGFAIAPPQHADARSDVRLHRPMMPER